MSSVVVYGLGISMALALCIVLLLRHEEKHGIRFADKTRRHADFFVLKVIHNIRLGLRYVGRDALRQIFHYVFHSLLSAILRFMRNTEDILRDAIRSNKTVARNAERESETLSKLEEIALHKIETALTEEEKRAHREKTLQGL